MDSSECDWYGPCLKSCVSQAHQDSCSCESQSQPYQLINLRDVVEQSCNLFSRPARVVYDVFSLHLLLIGVHVEYEVAAQILRFVAVAHVCFSFKNSVAFRSL